MNWRNLQICAAVAGAAWLMSPPPASAVCGVLCTCDVTATPLSFGTIDPLAAGAVDANATVTITCGPVGLFVGYDVRLSTGSSGAFGSRSMTGGANTLAYNLYTDAARTTIWGDGGGVTDVVSSGFTIALGSTSRSHTIYGRIPSLATAQPGAYADTITATIVW